MGILNQIFKLIKGIPESKPLNPLEAQRRTLIKEAKNEIYHRCFHKLEKGIPDQYILNRTSYTISINLSDISVALDHNTIHKVLTKAAYDAINKLDLKLTNNPLVESQFGYWSIRVEWERIL